MNSPEEESGTLWEGQLALDSGGPCTRSCSGLEVSARRQAFMWLLLTWAPRGLLGGAGVARGDCGPWLGFGGSRRVVLILLPEQRASGSGERTVMCVSARTPRLGWGGRGDSVHLPSCKPHTQGLVARRRFFRGASGFHGLQSLTTELKNSQRGRKNSCPWGRRLILSRSFTSPDCLSPFLSCSSSTRWVSAPLSPTTSGCGEPRAPAPHAGPACSVTRVAWLPSRARAVFGSCGKD